MTGLKLFTLHDAGMVSTTCLRLKRSFRRKRSSENLTSLGVGAGETASDPSLAYAASVVPSQSTRSSYTSSTLFDHSSGTAESVTTEECGDSGLAACAPTSCLCGRPAAIDSIYCSVACGRADALAALCAGDAPATEAQSHYRRTCSADISEAKIEKQLERERQPRAPPHRPKLTLDMLRSMSGVSLPEKHVSSSSPYQAPPIANTSTTTLHPPPERQSFYDATPTLSADSFHTTAFEYDTYSTYSYDPDVLDSLRDLDLEDIDQQQMLLDALHFEDVNPLDSILTTLSVCATLEEQQTYIDSLPLSDQHLLLRYLREQQQ